jgi:hypothetical protein
LSCLAQGLPCDANAADINTIASKQILHGAMVALLAAIAFGLSTCPLEIRFNELEIASVDDFKF